MVGPRVIDTIFTNYPFAVADELQRCRQIKAMKPGGRWPSASVVGREGKITRPRTSLRQLQYFSL